MIVFHQDEQIAIGLKLLTRLKITALIFLQIIMNCSS